MRMTSRWQTAHGGRLWRAAHPAHAAGNARSAQASGAEVGKRARGGSLRALLDTRGRLKLA
eukprot:3880773-Pyramimonas_sp.AAC.1